MSILKRRKPRTLSQSFRESVWPTMGWRRTFRYYRHRMFRTGDSAYRITAGLATGAVLSFTPFLGTHIVQALAVAWLIRASFIAAFVGTAMGNPWTYPFIFWSAYHTGVWVCHILGFSDFIALPEAMAQIHFMDQPLVFLAYLFRHPAKLLLPLTVGGYLLALLCWPVFYGIMYYPVRVARNAYHLSRSKHAQKKARHGKK